MPTFRSDVEAPTRPVTPTGDHPPKNGKTPSHLYHSESVAAVLQQLSKELIGSSDLSSHSQPPPLLNEDGDDKLASSTAYPQYPREFRAPGAMNDASPARQQQPQSQAQTAPSSHLAVPPHNSPVCVCFLILSSSEHKFHSLNLFSSLWHQSRKGSPCLNRRRSPSNVMLIFTLPKTNP